MSLLEPSAPVTVQQQAYSASRVAVPVDLAHDGVPVLSERDGHRWLVTYTHPPQSAQPGLRWEWWTGLRVQVEAREHRAGVTHCDERGTEFNVAYPPSLLAAGLEHSGLGAGS